MTLIVKNNSGAVKKFLSVKVGDGEERDISTRYSPFEISQCTKLNNFIASGELVINDGDQDLTPTQAAEVIADSDPYKGIVVLNSTDGTKKFKLQVDNAGILTTVEL